jgi:citronellol/citronellal dehydrogenase
MGESLQGRTAIITGASRGIGRAMALSLAERGVNIVVAAKSETSTELLPGTIHTVADEIRERGAEALAVRLDVRSEDEIQAMVERTIATFGRIDILINNAGALWWERLLDTPPKRYDLMWQINTRGPYLCAYHALPHMVGQGWGHIVNCSPPITDQPNPGYACYMTTKMGATRLALGIAAEHYRDNVAANSLWPATPVESLATLNWGTDKMGRPDQWRSPEILTDALVEIVTTPPKELTGRQLVDEPFLRERGWSDAQIEAYWLLGRAPPDPLWIDGRVGAGHSA